MDADQISESGGVDGRNVDFAENVHNVGAIVNGYIWFYFI